MNTHDKFWHTEKPKKQDKLIVAYVGESCIPEVLVLNQQEENSYDSILGKTISISDISYWMPLPKITETTTLPTDEFFTTVATNLRELWPTGEKDGKYPWRDSVSDLSKRLKIIWKERQLGDFSVEDCVQAGRRYLAQYEDNAKYMQTLKYFVFRQKSYSSKQGKVSFTYESKFADFLESNHSMSSLSEWEDIINDTNTYSTGELI